ncbi:MAG TPA: SRPBCC family protein [Nitrososphaerales archaeon]|nr:SRPBCC family protein [Nitrososphaerales archaeon]
MHLEVSRVVRARPERVYAAYTDFEAMPAWSARLKAVKVTSRDGNVVHLENETVSSDGRTRRRSGVLTLHPPSSVESESETRFTRTRRTVTFEASPDGTGTKVTAALDVQVKGLWAAVLRSGVKKEEAESAAEKELESFARFLEDGQQAGATALTKDQTKMG